MPQESTQKSKEIERIYNRAISQIKELEKKQRKIMQEFITDLEKRKIEAIRKTILNS